MAKVLVYDTGTNTMLTFNLSESAPMPYTTGTTLTVGEFRGSSRSPTLYTTTACMESWNNLRRTYGKAIPVGYAFKRIWEGGHSQTSQHYAGVALDMGQSLSNAQRAEIRGIASRSGVWSYVEPASLTPTWVHVDKRYGRSSCSGSTNGYPTVRQGSVGTYVIICQDALNALGYNAGSLDGRFGSGTGSAVMRFQRANGLTADGVVGCGTWSKLTKAALGIGRTPTVVD